MSPVLLFVVAALIVIAIAYGLGVYIRRRNATPTDLSPELPLPEKQLALSSGPATLPPGPTTPTDPTTRAVVAWLLSQAFEQTGFRLANDAQAYERIVNAARRAVQEIHTEDTQAFVTISLPFIAADASGPKHLEAHLTREAMAELARQ